MCRCPGRKALENVSFSSVDDETVLRSLARGGGSVSPWRDGIGQTTIVQPVARFTQTSRIGASRSMRGYPSDELGTAASMLAWDAGYTVFRPIAANSASPGDTDADRIRRAGAGLHAARFVAAAEREGDPGAPRNAARRSGRQKQLHVDRALASTTRVLTSMKETRASTPKPSTCSRPLNVIMRGDRTL